MGGEPLILQRHFLMAPPLIFDVTRVSWGSARRVAARIPRSRRTFSDVPLQY
jgi:hypothetical protein